MACEQTGEHSFPYHQGPIVRYGYHRLLHVRCLKILTENMSYMHHAPFSAKYLDSTGKALTSVAGSLGYVAPEVLNEKGHGKRVDLW